MFKYNNSFPMLHMGNLNDFFGSKSRIYIYIRQTHERFELFTTAMSKYSQFTRGKYNIQSQYFDVHWCTWNTKRHVCSIPWCDNAKLYKKPILLYQNKTTRQSRLQYLFCIRNKMWNLASSSADFNLGDASGYAQKA